MRVTIAPATLRDASFIAHNMREYDRREIGCVFDLSNPAALAAVLIERSPGFAYIASIDGGPVTCFGVATILPHLASAWAYGTPRLPRTIPAVTRFGLRELAPRLLRSQVRRVEVRTMADHDVSHRWLSQMGCRLETPTPYEYGMNGELFFTYAWTRRTFRRSA